MKTLEQTVLENLNKYTREHADEMSDVMKNIIRRTKGSEIESLWEAVIGRPVDEL